MAAALLLTRIIQIVGPVFATILLVATAGASQASPAIAGRYKLQRASGQPTGRINVQGWAVSRCGPPEVILSIDADEIARARPWLPSSDAPGSGPAGFATEIDPLHFLPGPHRVRIVASSPECREMRTLGDATFVSVSPPPTLIATAALILIVLVPPILAGFLAHRAKCRYLQLPLFALVPVLMAIEIAIIVMAPRIANSPPSSLFAPLANWDGAWYLLIAEKGYAANGIGAYAFFPLYPLLLRCLRYVPLAVQLTASIANTTLFFFALKKLRKVLPQSDSGLLFFACLPFAFFFVADYTESLALFLSLAFLSDFREGKPWRSFGWGLLAGLTRITSVALALLAIDGWRIGRRRESVVAAAGPLAGVATYMLYLYFSTGDALKFVHSQQYFGRASFSPGRLLQVVTRSLTSGDRWEWLALASVFVVLTGATVLALDRKPGEALYSAALVGLPLASVTLTSLHRYALLAFPVYPRIAGLLRNRAIYFSVVAAEVVLLFIFARHFGLQHWVG